MVLSALETSRLCLCVDVTVGRKEQSRGDLDV